MEIRRRRARQAVFATAIVYAGYGLLGLVPAIGEYRGVALVAAFYFLPSWLLRHVPEVQSRYQVGPDSPVPPWRWRGAWVALVAALVVFPPFVLGFWWFYQQVCGGDLRVLWPVLWIEGMTPWAGGLERFLAGLCRAHAEGFWPAGLHLPASWSAWGGLGFVRQVVEGLFAVALAEEVFHRGYVMSALEDLWPPRRTIFGAKFGLAAVLSSLLFAIGHLVGMAQAARLATFFPALVFAWLWRRSGSLWAPALFHTAANLLMDLLLASTFPA
ncbi:myxosortase MrtZ [Nannocystis sp.]|uniref:myxosortase MrtZ n=1 Tax=Nannocystis sp. TaxID=1962667 RepID=UPI0025F8A17B|nr:MrtZ family glutamic-type intramembrane protease [Nannocystis sp.]